MEATPYRARAVYIKTTHDGGFVINLEWRVESPVVLIALNKDELLAKLVGVVFMAPGT